MAIYQFSALADGQAISFNPVADQLRFDQTAITAAAVTITTEGSNLRFTAAGKSVILSNTALAQLAGTNVTLANGSALLVGDNNAGTTSDGAGNTLIGTSLADRVMGLGGNDSINAGGGNDWIAGGTGSDTLTGSGGQDSFAFAEFGAANADTLTDFAGNSWDSIRLDSAAFTAIGAAGRFASGDVRFWAGSAAHDADDRVIYNSATGQLWYDADGNGAGAAQLIATLSTRPSVLANDIWVFGTPTPPPPSGQTINGTAGNDSLAGTSGNDVINGLGGNDTLDGAAGSDTMDGGTGNDTFVVDSNFGDVVLDAGGVDTVLFMQGGGYTLADGIENLVLPTGFVASVGSPDVNLNGNDLNNVIRVEGDTGKLVFINGRGGHDTLIGGSGSEAFVVVNNTGNDSIDGGGGNDWLFITGVDMVASPIDFRNVERIQGDVGNERAVADDSGMSLHGGGGDDTLIGGAGDDYLGGDDTFDHPPSDFGSDILDGGTGIDTLDGSNDADAFRFTVAPGAANADVIRLFETGIDKIRLDANAMSELGTTGNFSSTDARFFAGTAAHDADDRVIYNTSTGQLFYDADGTGAAAAQLVATLEPGRALAATDIAVDNGIPQSTPFSNGVVSSYGYSSNDDTNALLTAQYKWGTGGVGTAATVTYSFRTNASVYSYSFEPGQAGWQPWSEQDKVFIRDALETWAEVANIRFVEVEDSATVAGDLRFGSTVDVPGTMAWAYYPWASASAGDMWFDSEFHATDTSLAPGTRSYQVVLHEIGHALGLKHSFESPFTLAPLQNNHAHTVMSAGFAFEGHNAFPAMPMLFDVAAVQHIYGANMTTRSGDDVYSWAVGEPIFDTLWDAGGSDTIDWSNQSTSAIVNLTAGTWSEIGPLRGEGPPAAKTLIIAHNVVIENASGGAAGDFLTGNSAGNVLAGGGGNDQLDGGAGADTLSGGTGADGFIARNSGADHIADFVSGADRVMLDNAAMTALGPAGDFAAGDARFAAGAGFTAGRDASDRVVYDTSTGNLYYDADGSGSGAAQLVATLDGAPVLAAQDITAGVVRSFSGASGDDSILGTAGDDVLRGFAGNDSLDGAAGNDSLEGGDGSDTLIGGRGTDTLNGGLGDDTYIVSSTEAHVAPDVIGDAGGFDVVFATGTWTLADGLENLEITRLDDFANVWGIGNALDNRITRLGTAEGFTVILDGGDGNDTLIGNDGWDVFEFKAGSGNFGSDVIDGGGSGDTVSFLDGFISGSNTARSAVVIDLRAGTLTGGGTGGSGSATLANVENAVGGMFDDLLIAHDGRTILTGGSMQTVGARLTGESGNDTLIGGAINDVLGGGAGADSYVFRHAPTAGATYDIITDFVSGTDKFRLDGSVLTGLGPSGNFGANDGRFYAASGASSAHDADDRIIYDTANGWVFYDSDGIGGAGALRLAFLSGPPALAATDFAVDNGTTPPPPPDTINGTPGNDSLVGGFGNETINGFAGDDTLIGASGDDSLDGGSGIDSMDGGTGNDIYVVTAGDVLVDAGGIDQVNTGEASWTLGTDFENLVFNAGTFATTAQGTNGANRMVGNDGDNYFNARAGNDTVIGNGGNDYFDMSTGMTSSPGNDSIDGGAGIDSVDYDGYARSALVANLASGVVTGGGDGGVGGATLSGIERFISGGFADRISGSNNNEYLDGRAGSDTINGGGGLDTLVGGAGLDSFVFTATNGDVISDFASGADKIRLDGSVMTALGASGNFAAGDARFFAGTAAHDADDRVVFDIASGNLWYDADGSGAGAAQLIAMVSGSAVSATDIAVDNGSAPPPPPPGEGQLITGTSGNDSLTGGAGNDTLDGGAGTDTMNGGAGNDTYRVTAGDVLSDPGGVDTVQSPVSWALGGAFENLEFAGTAAIGGSGNSLANRMVGNSAANSFRGREGADTLTGGGGADSFEFVTAIGGTNVDQITDFVPGTDKIRLDDAVHAGIGVTGNFVAGDGRFWSAAGTTTGHDANDRVIYDSSTGNLYYDADGSGSGAAQLIATLQGNPTVSATDIGVI